MSLEEQLKLVKEDNKEIWNIESPRIEVLEYLFLHNNDLLSEWYLGDSLNKKY